jgi:hypothetical protein
VATATATSRAWVTDGTVEHGARKFSSVRP